MSLGFRRPDPFARFVPGWYEAIASMDPIPAQVCVACPADDASGVDTPPADFPVPVRIVRVDDTNPTAFMRAAVEKTITKWLVWCGLDDRMTQHALADIAAGDAYGADIISQKARLSTGGVIGHWNVPALTRGDNQVAPNSPFTRAAYDRVGGWPDIHFHDWGLWMRMAAAGVCVLSTDTVGMEYDIGEDHVTRSGVLMPAELRARAMNEVASLAGELWPTA